MTDTLTNEQRQALLATMRKAAVRACVVQSDEEAGEFTANDKAGRVWSVGDEYYVLMREPK